MTVFTTLFPRRNPTLPQNDADREQTRRYKQLLDSQKKYQWTDELKNIVGVPMATKVPYYDEPSLPWLLLVTGVGLQLAENLIAVKLAQRHENNPDQKALKDKLDDIRKQSQSIRDLQKTQTDDPNTDLTKKFITITKQLLTQNNVSFYAMLEQFQKLNAELAADFGDLAVEGADTDNSLAQYRELFQTLPLPAIADTFMDDQSFARYRVAGPNPMLIECIQTLPAKLPLTQAQYQAVMGEHDSIAQALAEHRLYLLDYAELDYLAKVPGETDGLPKYVFAPLALFAIPKGGSSLTPVAIQCGQQPGSHPLFFPVAKDSNEKNPKNGAWWGWQMAKYVVQVAECNYHELFVHLARTHLVLEAFAVATYRNLADSHPLNVLLQPHGFGTLFINNAAAAVLISPKGPIDDFFGAPIERAQQASGTDRLNFDFYANMLPADLKRRGIADPKHLPDYPWRDDALLLWNAIHTWVSNYVGVYYEDDSYVIGDTELTAWSEDLIHKGLVKGFKPITSREQLADVLTMVIYTATAQHAAVNFPQRPLMTFSPAITGAGWTHAPAKQAGHTENQWLAMMPPIKYGLEQLNILHLLGSVHYRQLGDYRSNQFPYHHWFEDNQITKKDGPLAQFQQALQQVENTIHVRNSMRITYEFLLPSRIPNSINI
jgi:arachidonate 15-lipoxygenase